MSIYSEIPFIAEDRRVRRFLLPKKIAAVYGKVTDPEKLLIQKPLQIGLEEPSLTALENGAEGEHASVIVDFGIELHGGIRLMNYSANCSPSQGEYAYPMLRLTFGESFAEADSTIGENNATNDHSVRQMDITAPQLSDQEWGQTGFRFVKIELLNPEASVKIKSLLAVSIMNDFEYKGSFECDDPVINRIYNTAAYTCHLCLQNMVWDGIKRDRLVWIGDMMPETMTVRDVFGALPIVEESLDFTREITPLPGWMNGIPAYSMWWICILKDWYMACENKTFMQRQQPYLKGLLTQLCDRIHQDGSAHFTEWIFLDWPTNQKPFAKNGVYALMKMALMDGAYLLKLDGENDLAKRCEDSAESLKVGEETGGAKQIAAFLSLAGLTDRQTAADAISENGDRGYSSFLSYFILKALSLAGRDEQAVETLRSYYGAMLGKGATSFWEDYQSEWADESGTVDDSLEAGKKNIHADFGQFCYTGLRHSLCHGWSSGPVPYLTERVLGISIVQPGCKVLKIEPHLGGLRWARGVFPTPYGSVTVSHQMGENGTVKTEITAPKEVEIQR